MSWYALAVAGLRWRTGNERARIDWLYGPGIGDSATTVLEFTPRATRG